MTIFTNIFNKKAFGALAAVLLFASLIVPAQEVYARNFFSVIADPLCVIGLDCDDDSNNTPPRPLIVTCSANVTSTNIGSTVVWTAEASGSNKPFTFTWTGSDGLAGNQRSITRSYSSGGYKDARVTAKVAGRAAKTVSCSNSVYVTPAHNTETGNLTVSCFPDSTSINTNQTVVWRANASGGSGSYSYTWSGTDGLNGSGSSLGKSYSYAGSKTANVVVTTGTGESRSISCNQAVYVQYYNDNPYTPTNPINGTCYASPANVTVGQSVTWNVSANGGNGYYTYSWSGTDNLYGNNSNVNWSYSTPGYKTASVYIVSDGRNTQINCSGSVNVGGHYNQPPVYYPPTTTYSQLDVSCGPNTRSARIGDTVAWSANVVGGNGQYTYAWSGTDGVSGNNSALRVFYDTVGTKYASVTVQSNGQVITRACTSGIAIANAATSAPRPTTPSVTYAPLNVICTANPGQAAIGQPVSWVARVTGGSGVYKYSWTGAEDLFGTSAVVTKSYQATGQKFAIVNVTSAGKSFSKACDTVVSVGSNLGAFSLGAFAGGISWGLFGFFIFLILLAILGYVMYNKEKI